MIKAELSKFVRGGK